MEEQIGTLADRVAALDKSVAELRAAVDYRTRIRAAVTLTAAVAVAIVGMGAAVVVVNEKVRAHATADHRRWCLVWGLLDDPVAGVEARRSGC